MEKKGSDNRHIHKHMYMHILFNSWTCWVRLCCNMLLIPFCGIIFCAAQLLLTAFAQWDGDAGQDQCEQEHLKGWTLQCSGYTNTLSLHKINWTNQQPGSSWKQKWDMNSISKPFSFFVFQTVNRMISPGARQRHEPLEIQCCWRSREALGCCSTHVSCMTWWHGWLTSGVMRRHSLWNLAECFDNLTLSPLPNRPSVEKKSLNPFWTQLVSLRFGTAVTIFVDLIRTSPQAQVAKVALFTVEIPAFTGDECRWTLMDGNEGNHPVAPRKHQQHCFGWLKWTSDALLSSVWEFW